MNFILCMTPLQVLIAEKIIQHQPADYVGVYLTDMPNTKHQYYANRLAKSCQKSVYIPLPTAKKIDKFLHFSKIKQALNGLDCDLQDFAIAFFANYDLIIAQYVLANIRYQRLMTFDDGTANIFPNSRYFLPPPQAWQKQLFKKMLNITLTDTLTVKAISERHFSIFTNEKNVMDNVEVIHLFEKLEQVSQPLTQHKKILLGQALDSFIGEHAYRTLVQQMIQQFGITDFVPHPREKINFSDTLNVITSDKIIEDYLLDAIADNPDTQYKIYTFMSTAVFSLKDFPRTQIFLVYNQALMAQFKDAYEFLASRGFALIDMDKAG